MRRLLFCFGTAALVCSSCSSSPANSSSDGGDDGSPLHDGAADEGADTSSPPPPHDAASEANASDAHGESCTPAGGICIPLGPGSACPAGYHSANGAESCLVGAECCLKGGDAGVNGCMTAGGVCVSSALACGTTVGHLGTPIEDAFCMGANAVCCFEPATSCGGVEMFGCSDGMTCSRPQCQAGTLVCGTGTSQTPLGTPPC